MNPLLPVGSPLSLEQMGPNSGTDTVHLGSSGLSGTVQAARFAQTSCSQCGKALGPGDAGVSHCSDHAAPARQYMEAVADYLSSVGAVRVERLARTAIMLMDRERREWQPIETAPSDLAVLLYTPDLHMTNPERVEVRVYHDSRAGTRHAWATHWMPPPAPPMNGADNASPRSDEKEGAL